MSEITPNSASIIDEWLNQHRGYFSEFIVQLAIASYKVHTILRHIAQESAISKFNPDDWQRCFTTIPNWRGLLSQLIINYISAGGAGIATPNDEWSNFDYATTMNHPDDSTANLHADAMKAISENPPSPDIFTDYSLIHENLAALGKESHDNEAIPEGFIAQMLTPEFLFLFEIAIPCYLFHGETVEDLLAKVKSNSDFQAARKLVELDRAFLQHPDLLTFYRDLKDKKLAEQLTHSANNSKGYEKLTLQKVKYLLLALMLELQEQFVVVVPVMLIQQQQDITRLREQLHEAKTITEKNSIADLIILVESSLALLSAPFLPLSALRNLFDLVARIKHGNPNLAHDPDLPPTMKGLESGVTRARELFSQVKFFENMPFLHQK